MEDEQTMLSKASSLLLQQTQRQTPRLNQQMVMSQQMQQAFRFLQLPLQELTSYIEEQLVLNPLLEIAPEKEKSEQKEEEKEIPLETELCMEEENLSLLYRLEEEMKEHFAQDESVYTKNSKKEEELRCFLEQSLPASISMRESLIQQSQETFQNPEDLMTADILIGYIDREGFLKTPLEEIQQLHSLSIDDLKRVLLEVQAFQPSGIGASSVQESLLIQLRSQNKQDSLAYVLVRDYYEELLHHQIRKIQKKLKCSFEIIQEAIDKEIATLDLHPGFSFSSQVNAAIIPDVIIRQENEKLVVEVEKDYVPPIRFNRKYLKMLQDPVLPLETKKFIKTHIFSAHWLMKNLQERYSTIERVTQSLARIQYDFFTSSEGELVPLSMKMIAEELELHESTITRAVSNKYLFCPRGLFPLRAFFTNKVESTQGEILSSKTVKNALLRLIEKENKQHPLSDEKLSQLLEEEGFSCARRTVAKYRSSFAIGNTQQRRKFSS